MKEQKGKKGKKTDKRTLSFFIMIFPSLLISIIGLASIESFLLAGIIIGLQFFSAVLLKQFVEDYYKTF